MKFPEPADPERADRIRRWLTNDVDDISQEDLDWLWEQLRYIVRPQGSD